MSDTNVNPNTHLSNDVNNKEFRLSSQMKKILIFLYNNYDRVYQQVEIIENLFDEVTNSRKVSVSRSINRLMEVGLVDSRKSHYSPDFDCWIRDRVHFFLTEEGKEYVETRFGKEELGGGSE